ncbi:MAG: hypothetical protein AB7O59_24380 [Pirellulales bacterium]
MAALTAGLVLLGSGCTHLGLQRRTILQGSTISDIQDQQVLDNLAMFACDRDAMAWHVKITGGLVQVADQGTGFLGANLGGPHVLAPNVGVGRNIVGQWNLDPTIEADELGLLQIAYRKAINPLDADGSIRHEAYEQICELAGDYHIVLSYEVATDVLRNLMETATGHDAQRLEQLQRELDVLYAEIEELSIKPNVYDPQEQRATGGDPPTKLDFLKEEVIRLLHESCHNSVEQVRAYHRPGRNVGLVEQAQDKIEALVQLVDEDAGGEVNPFSMPWLCHGCKDDVPPCACLVGRYCACGRECYVWVTPDNAARFRAFVLIVLALAPPTAQDMAPAQSGLGAANSPTL